MPSFATIRTVRHDAAKMYALVADVERYPEFLPLCEALTVRERRHDGERQLVLAAMTVGYKAIRETFTSQVLLDPGALTIRARYVDGPFRALDNRWTFTQRPDGGCDVGFSIDYEFKSRMLGAVMGAMFDRAFRSFAEAFEKRADAVYGTPSP